jgi:hypothetical protein
VRRRDRPSTAAAADSNRALPGAVTVLRRCRPRPRAADDAVPAAALPPLAPRRCRR